MTQVLNFCAGPAAGKTTIAHEVFSTLKKKHVSVGWVEEFPTNLVWEENFKGMKDQLWILGEQNHRLYSQLNKVDYIVMDSCMLLGIHYLEDAFAKFKKSETTAPYDDFKWSLINTINCTFNMYMNKVYFVDRQDRVIHGSRYGADPPTDDTLMDSIQLHNQRVKIDEAIKGLLDNYRVSYKIVNNAEQVINDLNL